MFDSVYYARLFAAEQIYNKHNFNTGAARAKKPVGKWKHKTDRISIAKAHQQQLNFDGICIFTGVESNLTVIDIDIKYKHGDDILELRNEIVTRCDLSETACITTPSGGEHYYFLHEPQIKTTSLSHNSNCIGIDTRNDGGIVIAPPTQKYEFQNTNLTNLRSKIQPMPDGLIKILTDLTANKNTTKTFKLSSRPNTANKTLKPVMKTKFKFREIHEGERNNYVNSYLYTKRTKFNFTVKQIYCEADYLNKRLYRRNCG